MIFLDTSYFVALAMPADALHATALKWSECLSGPFLTTEFVLLEVVNMLSGVGRRAKAHALLESLANNSNIRVERASSKLFHLGLRLHANRPDKSWSLTDCISFEVMRGAALTDALTYDQDFEQAGFRPLLRLSPP